MNSTSIDRVDHLIYHAPDLKTGMDELAAVFAVQPAAGGRHPAFGTHNALLSLGPEIYLEIIAGDPGLPSPPGGRLFSDYDTGSSRLLTWVMRAENIASVAANAATAGLDVGNISTGRRQGTDGDIVSWQMSDPYLARLQGAVPFLISWGETPHPGASAPLAGRLTELRIAHPSPAAVGAAFRALDVSVPVTEGTDVRLMATIETAAGVVKLG